MTDASQLADGQWHRLHPLTPLFRGGLVLVIVAGIIISNFRERFVEWLLPMFVPSFSFGDEAPRDPLDYVLEHGLIPLAALAVLVVLLVVLGLFYLSWRFHTFRITGDDVEVRNGVLFRQHRRAPLDRVQGVNLTRPMFARLCGMAKLEVVGAGTGADANVRLEYLSTANAEAVRADILRLASGAQGHLSAAPSGADAAPGADPTPGRPSSPSLSRGAAVVSDGITGLIVGAEQPVADPQSVVRIPPGRLVASHLLSGSTVALLLIVAGIVVGAVVSTPRVLFALIPSLLVIGAYWVRTITRALRYSIAPTPNGIRVTFGLFTTVTEILPPGRVHAVQVTQPLLWRPWGWWSVRVNRLSGHGAPGRASDQFATVLPVGTRADIERVLRLLLPGRPDDEWPAVLEDGLVGPRDDDPYVNTPRRARLLRPLSWRRNGYLIAPDALFLRRGAIWRSLAVFPLARMQSISIAQGPVDRMLRTAVTSAHTIPGLVSGELGAVDREAALHLFDTVEAQAISAAAGDRSHRWAGGGTHG